MFTSTHKNPGVYRINPVAEFKTMLSIGVTRGLIDF
jgi:hypothetical protein